MRRLWLSVTAVVIAAGALTACSTSDDGEEPSSKGTTAAGAKEADSPTAKEKEAPAAPADVKLVKQGWEDHEVWGPHSYVVHWELTNTGAKAGNFYAGLEFLDKDGDVLGSTGITADKLGPGKTSKGDTAPLDAEITNGKMGDIKKARVSEVERLDG